MKSCSLFLPSVRRVRLLSIALLLVPTLLIYILWYAENSDKDDVPSFLTHIIPAGAATCRSSTVFKCSSCLDRQNVVLDLQQNISWTFEYGRDDRNLGLDEDRCNAAFPGLFEDIAQGVEHWKARGKISRSVLDSITLEHGMTRAMISNGSLYVVETKSKAEDHRRKTIATLSSMHRALAAVQDKASIPNIEFFFSIEDKASDTTGVQRQPVWVLARKASETSFFLLPDFGFWAWDNIIEGKNNEIGPFDEVVDKAVIAEAKLPFDQKTPQLVWRGKLSFAPKLRRGLLDAARGTKWNNVKEIDWAMKENYLSLEDHCKYKYIAHVEGRSYSASLKYRQACRSVIVAHELQYIQHHHYLLVSSGDKQNYVEVKRDFSDLANKMQDLLKHPKKANRIADNSVRTFRERYLTPAAEACYWRALWRGYGIVAEPARLWHNSVNGKKRKRGLRWETFVLLSSEEMMDFKAGRE